MHYLNRLLFITLTIILLLPLSCKKSEETTETKPAPELPPQSSFVMDFNDFTNVDTTATKNTMTYHNWGWAALNVGVWNSILTIGLVVPVAAFYESFNHEGVYDPETSSWVWSYNFNAAGSVYLAQLHASLVTEGIQWQMYISKNNGFSDFLWYEGISNLVNTEGNWHLYESPESPAEILLIEWHRDIPNNAADIKYTNVKPEAPDNGGYIFYSIDAAEPYNANYDIYNATNDNLTEIEWNKTTKNGRVKDAVHFGNTDWNCWDENLMDNTCP